MGKLKEALYVLGEWIIIAFMVGVIYVFVTLTLGAG